MSKVYCFCCGNEIPELSVKNALYSCKLWGDIDIPLCEYCYKYTGIKIEQFKWDLFLQMHEKAKLMQQKIMEDLETEEKDDE